MVSFIVKGSCITNKTTAEILKMTVIKKIEDKKYYFLDGLYNDEFGIKITFDNNDLVNGFEMSYAPDNIDRIERTNMLSTDQPGKEIRLEPDIKYEKLERGKNIYYKTQVERGYQLYKF